MSNLPVKIDIAKNEDFRIAFELIDPAGDPVAIPSGTFSFILRWRGVSKTIALTPRVGETGILDGVALVASLSDMPIGQYFEGDLTLFANGASSVWASVAVARQNVVQTTEDLGPNAVRVTRSGSTTVAITLTDGAAISLAQAAAAQAQASASAASGSASAASGSASAASGSASAASGSASAASGSAALSQAWAAQAPGEDVAGAAPGSRSARHFAAQAEQSAAAAAVSASPGGSDTQVQFNNAGAFAGDAAMTFNSTTKALTLGAGLNVATGAVTTSQPLASFTQEWNASGVTFVGQLANITDTASAAASVLEEWQVGGVRRAAFRKDGALLLGSAGGGIADGSGGTLLIINGGTSPYVFGNINLSLVSRGLSFGATLGAQDVILTRKAAAILQLGAADAAAPVAQTVCAQSVVAGTTNTAGAATVIAGSQGTGTGVGGSVAIRVAPAGSSGTTQNALADGLVVNGDRSVSVPTFLTVGDNSGSFGRLTIGIGQGQGLVFGNRGRIASLSDGQVIVTNNAQNGFDRFVFGSATSAFPALKRSGAELQARLADDSGFTTLDGLLRTQGTAPATTTTAGTAGDIRYDSGFIYVCIAANTWRRAALGTW